MSNFFLPFRSTGEHIVAMCPLPKRNTHGGKRPGAGRKPTCEDPVMIAAQVPAKIRDKLDRFAEANDMSRSAALVEAIRRLKL